MLRIAAAFRRASRRASRAAPSSAVAAILLRLAACAWLVGAAPAALAFALEDVAARAQVLMSEPYVAPVSNLPAPFVQMQYGDYEKIHSRRERFGWRDLGTPFKLNFYHQGMQFNTPVQINEIDGDAVREIRYEPDRFDFNNLPIDAGATRALGYAGFRVLYPINQAGKEDEVMSFLGASYFRVIGKGQVYGLSGRALAIDTALAMGSGEEFPRFREFWIRRPTLEDQQLVVYALLDSPRSTGAYEFTLRPGDDAVLDVRARVFMRDGVSTLGIAPLTSMFLFSPSQQSDKRNYRPAIHDSNGLGIHTGADEWLWRPLNNPQALNVSSFAVDSPRGFGLMQRGREFSRFEDLKDRYDLRPSAWIEPKGDWGRGRVQLVEIPTQDETNDNIVAFWTPEHAPVRGQSFQFDYRMHWTMAEPALLAPQLAWVRQTFHSAGEQTQANLIRALDGSTAFLVDFEGPAVAAQSADAKVSVQASANANAELLGTSLQRNPAIAGWRMTLRVKVKDPKQPVELRAALVEGGKPISETWSYQLPPVPNPALPASPAR